MLNKYTSILLGALVFAFTACREGSSHQNPTPPHTTPGIDHFITGIGSDSTTYLLKLNSYFECLAASGKSCRLQNGDQNIILKQNLAPRLYDYTVHVNFACKVKGVPSNIWITAGIPTDPSLEISINPQYGEEKEYHVKGFGDLRLEDRNQAATLATEAEPGCSLYVEVLDRTLLKAPAELECETHDDKEWIGGVCFDKLKPENILFRTTDHCTKGIDQNTYVSCEPIPRPGLPEIVVRSEGITQTESRGIRNLAFVSQFSYINYCPSEVSTAAALVNDKESEKLKQDNRAVVHTFQKPVSIDQLLELKFTRAAVPNVVLWSVPSFCMTAITDNLRMLDLSEDNIKALKTAVRNEPVEAKNWIQGEISRIVGRNADSYRTLLESILSSSEAG